MKKIINTLSILLTFSIITQSAHASSFPLSPIEIPSDLSSDPAADGIPTDYSYLTSQTISFQIPMDSSYQRGVNLPQLKADKVKQGMKLLATKIVLQFNSAPRIFVINNSAVDAECYRSYHDGIFNLALTPVSTTEDSKVLSVAWKNNPQLKSNLMPAYSSKFIEEPIAQGGRTFVIIPNGSQVSSTIPRATNLSVSAASQFSLREVASGCTYYLFGSNISGTIKVDRYYGAQ